MRVFLTVAALLVSVGRAGLPAIPDSNTFAPGASPRELADYLRHWAHRVQDKPVRDRNEAADRDDIRLGQLPPIWRVTTREGEYRIATAPLQQWLSGAGSHRNRAAAAVWMIQLAGQLESYEDGMSSSDTTRYRLQSILQRPEFAASARSALAAAWQKRVAAYLASLFEQLFGGLVRNTRDSWPIAYVVLAAALAAIGFFVYRFVRPNRNHQALIPAEDHSAASLRPWRQWLQAAFAAARDGDLRKAIHCAYWTGVTRLQEAGQLPFDGTYTPREYLRAFEGAGTQAQTLRLLTTYLEQFWYARAEAHREDLDACLGSLEVLGCRLD